MSRRSVIYDTINIAITRGEAMFSVIRRENEVDVDLRRRHIVISRHTEYAENGVEITLLRHGLPLVHVTPRYAH